LIVDNGKKVNEATHMTKASTEKQAEQVGKFFNVKLEGGRLVKMECIEWDCEKRVFKCEEGFLDLDWMEYTDQASLGRITQVDEQP